MTIEVDCPQITASNQSLTVRMPGGATLSVQVPEISPGDFAVAKNLISQANSALAPLSPLFKLIDALLAVKKVIDAIPDAFGPPPNPTGIIEAIPELAETIADLAALIPQVSTPIMIVDLIDLLITALNGLIVQLEAVVNQQAKIAEAELQAELPGNEALLPVLVCARSLNEKVMADIGESAKPLNTFLQVLNLFLSILGLEPIPDLGDLGEDAEDAISTLREVTNALAAVRDAIPIP